MRACGRGAWAAGAKVMLVVVFGDERRGKGEATAWAGIAGRGQIGQDLRLYQRR